MCMPAFGGRIKVESDEFDTTHRVYMVFQDQLCNPKVSFLSHYLTNFCNRVAAHGPVTLTHKQQSTKYRHSSAYAVFRDSGKPCKQKTALLEE